MFCKKNFNKAVLPNWFLNNISVLSKKSVSRVGAVFSNIFDIVGTMVIGLKCSY